MKIRNFLQLDFSLLFSSVILAVFGVLSIYSAGISGSGESVSSEYIRQIIWAIVGIVIALALAMSNYARVYHISTYLYLASLALLALTLFFGTVVNGAKSWIRIGSFGGQPAEFAKITTILFLARYLDMSKRNTNDLKRFAVSCAVCFAPMMLIFAQPDFGTSMAWLPLLVAMPFAAGIAARYILFVTLSIALTALLVVLPFWQTMMLKADARYFSLLSSPRFVAGACVLLALIFVIAYTGYARYRRPSFYWIDYAALMLLGSLALSFAGRKMLKEYQVMRLIVFLDPNVDPRGSGWNIIQSVMAIGSGGFLGKGYLQGTQSHYRFLPMQSTDFVFSIFSEEMGFAGGMLVFALFLTICMRLISIMKSTQDAFGQYICAGLAGLYIFHFMVNAGMTMGVMPITGIPLLFMSYGGSALIAAMSGIGLALSVHARRYRL